jgi:hypothetical protein
VSGKNLFNENDNHIIKQKTIFHQKRRSQTSKNIFLVICAIMPEKKNSIEKQINFQLRVYKIQLSKTLQNQQCTFSYRLLVLVYLKMNIQHSETLDLWRFLGLRTSRINSDDLFIFRSSKFKLNGELTFMGR